MGKHLIYKECLTEVSSWVARDWTVLQAQNAIRGLIDTFEKKKPYLDAQMRGDVERGEILRANISRGRSDGVGYIEGICKRALEHLND